MTTIGVGVIGLGFMGRTHVEAVHAAVRAGLPCRLAAVCDGDRARFSQESSPKSNLASSGADPLFDPGEVRIYTDPEQLFRDPSVQLVSICTWTDTHVDLARRAMHAGKHVLVEKPVALSSSEVLGLAEDARRLERLCMPAMCMRWWPGWMWLRAQIVDAREGRGEHGRLLSATFHRLGPAPSWADFYGDETRSGGALFDLHIHDVDFILWCFGMPKSVTAAGSLRQITSTYLFEDGPAHVVAEGSWTLTAPAGFQMRYQACFENAVVEFENGREHPVRLHRNQESVWIAIPEVTRDSRYNGYAGEMAAIVKAIANGDSSGLPTLRDACAVTRVLEAERDALPHGLRTLEVG
jgi:predicted dehydrogenase